MKLMKKIASALVACGLMASMGIVNVSANYDYWDVYQYQGAPTSSCKYYDYCSVYTSSVTDVICIATSVNLPSGNVRMYSPGWFDSTITSKAAGAAIDVPPNSYISVSISLNTFNYSTHTASGYFGF